MSEFSNSFKIPTLGEVESSLADLDAAIIGHTKWLTEWNTRVICGIPVEQRYISEESYRESYFGRWYYSQHADFMAQNPLFTSIGECHRMVHLGMSAIIEKIHNGEPITRSDYSAFIDTEASFSESLISLRDELFKLLLSFDHLTGALNRQAFFHLLEQEYARVKRFGEPGCVVVIDADNFKKVNDSYGHAAGDRVLIAITNLVVANMRPYDSICRYGGEEFLICMPMTTVEAAHNIIDRIREKLSQKDIELPDGEHLKVSASFGIAPMSAQEELKETIEHADKALYRAKVNGRNRVEVWHGSGDN
jgi:diguanylate cyclase (GGDEF)-like protein